MSPWWGLRNLVRHPVRSALAILGVAVASALLLDMVLLAGGLERSFERLILGRGYQIRVTPKGTLPFDSDATLAGASALLATIRNDPGVAQAGALLGTTVYAEAGDSLLPLVGYGVEPSAQGVYELLAGADLAPDDRLGVLVGETTAGALGVRPGDTLVLQGRLDPQVATPTARKALVVRGVVRWLYDDRAMRSVGAVLPVMQALATHARGDRASVIMVRAHSDVEAPAVAARLADRLPMVSVASVADLVIQFRERIMYFRQLSAVLGVISLVVMVLLVTTMLTITVNERLAEVATLRALGVARGTIVQQVLVEGAAITVAGGVLGTGLGVVTARYLDGILTSFPGLPATVSFFVPAAEPLAMAALVLLLTGPLASAWPAWVAARAPIADTLRGEAT